LESNKRISRSLTASAVTDPELSERSSSGIRAGLPRGERPGGPPWAPRGVTLPAAEKGGTSAAAAGPSSAGNTSRLAPALLAPASRAPSSPSGTNSSSSSSSSCSKASATSTPWPADITAWYKSDSVRAVVPRPSRLTLGRRPTVDRHLNQSEKRIWPG
jgi:hypothetical protein